MKFRLFIVVLLLGGCQSAMDKHELKQSLLQTDIAFSKLSVEKGTAFAFDYYMDDKAVIYKDNHHPFSGRENVNKLFNAEATDTLRWKPTFADVAESGDLGYTLGEYIYTGEEGDTSTGYYVSIWKKQDSGEWKYVFDTGINGPEE